MAPIKHHERVRSLGRTSVCLSNAVPALLGCLFACSGTSHGESALDEVGSEQSSGGSPADASTGGGHGEGATSGGGTLATGGVPSSGGVSDNGPGGSSSNSGGMPSGGSLSGGGPSDGGGGAIRGETGGASSGTGGVENSGSGGEGGGAQTGTCTESDRVQSSATGSGAHDVIVETNSDPGINEGTIFRPADMDGSELFPILVWGQGACSRDGMANEDAMVEIASHGYFVVADGTPNGNGSRTMDRSDLEGMGAPLSAYVDWVIAENEKPCSAYYGSIAVSKVSANGFSCGGLMAQGTVLDDRIVTWGVTSSGMAGANQSFYDLIDTPVLFVEGGPDEVAYDGGLEGYQNIADLGVPVLWFSKNLGHGGDLFQPGGGDFTKINLAWLNWWLKDDETATGKGLLVGSTCPYCSDAEWEVMSANID